MSADLLRDLARAKAVFQLRAIQAIVCADARSKPDQETATHPPPSAPEPLAPQTPHQPPPCKSGSQDQGAHGQTFRGGVFLMGERRRRVTIFHA